MAGYVTKHVGYMYEGEFANGETSPIENGAIVSIDATTKTMKLATSATKAFLAKEETTIYDGMPAYRFQVVAAADGLFLVDNNADINTSEAYDTRTYKTAAGELLRAHPLQNGEEILVTTTKTIAVGTAYGVTAGIIG